MEWMSDRFEPGTRSYLCGEYQMLIIDGHASHVSTEFIRFAREHKIVCLCWPAHSTHLLQPLDVRVFGSLKQNYKTLLAKRTRFTTYNIDKADFISLKQKARQQSITSRKIQSMWRATGLILYNPSAVFEKILTSHTDSSTLSSANIPILFFLFFSFFLLFFSCLTSIYNYMVMTDLSHYSTLLLQFCLIKLTPFFIIISEFFCPLHYIIGIWHLGFYTLLLQALILGITHYQAISSFLGLCIAPISLLSSLFFFDLQLL